MAGPPNISESNSSYSVLSIEQFELQEFLRDDIAVVVYLIFLCIVGTIGNGHAFIVYLAGTNPQTTGCSSYGWPPLTLLRVQSVCRSKL